ncbi:MAG: hypothetical protein M5U07_07175 [Xanthobacteraceae bacterium]|nr:hypothetical protein [Xanthobacteraceae bacterium]
MTKAVLGAAFVVALAISPAAAWENCASKKQVMASTPSAPATPVQTAEAPSTTQTK